MKKGILFLLTFIICIGLCFYLRGNVVYLSFDKVLNSTQKIDLSQTFEGFSDNHPRNIYLDNYININDFDELCSQSDIIASISVKEREQKFNIVETTVNINKCYKGSTNSQLIIYEPICFTGKKICVAYSSIPLLHKNQDYLVFLKKVLPNDDKHYNLLNTCLGVYPLKDDLSIKTYILKDGEDIDFKELSQYDMIKLDYSKLADDALDKESVKNYYKHINKYENFHKKVMKQFK